jgi:hypothetical protein
MTPDEGSSAARLPRGALVALYLSIIAVLAILPIAARLENVPVSEFMRDVFSIAEIPVYSGIASNLGVFLWCAGAAIGSFAALLVGGGEPTLRRFLAASAGISAIFMIDDFFMVHEWLVPRFLGWPEEAAYLVYGGVFALYVIAYRRSIRSLAPGLFVIAAAVLALSVGIDLVHEEEESPWGYYVEDGIKLLGVASWLAFVAGAAASAIGYRFKAPRGGVDHAAQPSQPQ